MAKKDWGQVAWTYQEAMPPRNCSGGLWSPTAATGRRYSSSSNNAMPDALFYTDLETNRPAHSIRSKLKPFD